MVAVLLFKQAIVKMGAGRRLRVCDNHGERTMRSDTKGGSVGEEERKKKKKKTNGRMATMIPVPVRDAEITQERRGET